MSGIFPTRDLVSTAKPLPLESRPFRSICLDHYRSEVRPRYTDPVQGDYGTIAGLRMSSIPQDKFRIELTALPLNIGTKQTKRNSSLVQLNEEVCRVLCVSKSYMYYC